MANEKMVVELDELDRARVRVAIRDQILESESDARLASASGRYARAEKSELRASHYRRILALFAVLLCGCAAEHGRIEGPPLYVHLCDAMPAVDQEAWGAAAGAINAELGGPVLWVGHGPPAGCDTVDVCAGEPRIAVGECVVRVRYAPGSSAEVARAAYEAILEAL